MYKWYQIAQNITDVDCLDKEGTPCSKVKCDWLAYLYVIELIVLNFWQAFQGETSWKSPRKFLELLRAVLLVTLLVDLMRVTLLVDLPLKYRVRIFLQKKLFVGGTNLFGQFMGSGGSCINAFSSNLNTVNLKTFPNRWDIHLKIKPFLSRGPWPGVLIYYFKNQQQK